MFHCRSICSRRIPFHISAVNASAFDSSGLDASARAVYVFADCALDAIIIEDPSDSKTSTGSTSGGA
jgi:hypothetical protein